MATFNLQTVLPVPRDEAFAWFARDGALVRLWPPFGGSIRQEPSDGLNPGSEAVMSVAAPGALGLAASALATTVSSPLRPEARWLARYTQLDPGWSFTDLMVSGPFRSWHHRHTFADLGQGTVMTDVVTYDPPAPLANRWGQALVTKELEHIFAYRGRQVVADLEFHRALNDRRQTVAVTGASGLIGTQLCALLETGGHRVLRAVRRPVRVAEEIFWDPEAGTIDQSALEACDAVVHLAGHPIGGRFSPENKRRILDSRRKGTALVAEALANIAGDGKVRTLVAASAIGYYGAQPHAAERARALPAQPLTEGAPAGEDFLAQVCRAWENECLVAARAGVRVVNIRTGLVLTPAGGLLARFLPIYLAGIGGPLGREQWQSWVGVDDIVSIHAFAVLNQAIEGPLNAVAPHPVTASEFAATLSRVLHRPSQLPVPAFVPHLLLGAEGARELAGADQLVSSSHVEKLGYRFRHRDLETQLRHALAREPFRASDSRSGCFAAQPPSLAP